MPTTTLTCASPPRRWPTSAIASLTRRSAMPPSVITLPARKKKGRASSVKALMPVNICCTATISGRSATQITSSEDRISANEIGTPRTRAASATPSSSVSGWIMRRGRRRWPRWRHRSRSGGSRARCRSGTTSIISTALSGMTMVGTNSVMPSAGDRRCMLSCENCQPVSDHQHGDGQHAQVDEQPLRGGGAAGQQSRRRCRTRSACAARSRPRVPRKTHQMNANSDSSSPHRNEVAKR